MKSWRYEFTDLTVEEISAHYEYLAEYGGPGYCRGDEICYPPPYYNPPNKRFEATGPALQVEPGNGPDASTAGR